MAALVLLIRDAIATFLLDVILMVNGDFSPARLPVLLRTETARRLIESVDRGRSRREVAARNA